MGDKDNELIFLSESLESVHDDLFWSQVKEFISISYLPELKFAEERFLVPEDFVEHKLLINRNLKTLLLVTKNLIKKFTDNVNVDDEIIQLLILLCGENMGDELWTTKEIVKTTENLLDDFLIFLNISNLKKLLFEYKINFAFTLLTKLRPKLLKDSWKRFPSAISCYKFLLFHIESPHLSENIDSVLPTALIILDDHVVSNRATAIKCIEHIINNSTSTDLTLLGRGNLLYKTMEPLIHFRDPEVFPELISCIIALLTKTEHPEELKWTHFDDVFNIWLPGIEIEQKIKSRIMNMQCLTKFIKAAGIACIFWSQCLMKIFTEYSLDKATCGITLQALHEFIKLVWPTSKSIFPSVLFLLITVLHQWEDSPNNEEITSLAKSCAMLVTSVNSTTAVMDSIDDETKAAIHPIILECLEEHH